MISISAQRVPLKKNKVETCNDRTMEKLIIDVECDENNLPTDNGNDEIDSEWQQEEELH